MRRLILIIFCSIFVLSCGGDSSISGGKDASFVVEMLGGSVSLPSYNADAGLLTYTTQLMSDPSLSSTQSMLAEIAPNNLSINGVIASLDQNIIDEPDLTDSSKYREQETQILNEMIANPDFKHQLQKKTSILGKTYNVGDVWSGIIIDGGYVIDATLEYESNIAYYFVEQNSSYSLSQEKLMRFVGDFEQHYNMMVTTFGQPNDTDNNGKIIVMIADLRSTGLLGYFYFIDKFSKSTYAESNEADIVYVNLTYMNVERYHELMVGTLIHELQHLLLFDNRYNQVMAGTRFSYVFRDAWLNEGLSMLAEVIIDVDISAYINSFLKNADTQSLINWTSSNYGYSTVFMTYLYDRFGEAEFIRKIYQSTNEGVQAIEDATGEDFNAIFKDFMMMLAYAPYGEQTNAKYNMKSIDLKANAYYSSYNSANVQYNVFNLATTISQNASAKLISMEPYSIHGILWWGQGMNSISFDKDSTLTGYDPSKVPYGIAIPNVIN